MRERIKPAGEAPGLKNAVFEGRVVPPNRDPELADKPKRRCARCGKRFQPTAKRRMLCKHCFGLGGGYDD